MMPFEDAVNAVLERIRRLETESVLAADALGCVLAQDVVADVDIAPFDNSAMDGYAVQAADLASATESSPVVLRVVDHIAAGANPTIEVTSGQAARIMTGAPIPPGADSVVMVEYSMPMDADGQTGGTVGFAAPTPLGAHVRLRGEDVKAGEVVLQTGEVVSPSAIGLLASVGATAVQVYRRPRVAIVVTGDELVDPAEKPGPGRIRNSNGPVLSALVTAAGGVPHVLGVAKDNEPDTEALLSRAPEFDLMISTGGVSMGDFDVVRTVLERIGVMDFWKVAIKPGVAQAYGTIGETPFFGLPGNPSSTVVGFELFIRPAIRKMRGFSALHRPRVSATLAHDVRKKVGRRHFLRAILERDDAPAGEGVRFRVELAGKQSSAMLTTMHRANCLVSLPAEGDGAQAGAIVECIRLDVEEGTP
jgi:molybdopterin molybdotransferase